MAHPFFKGAAFLGKNGVVYYTGSFHDLNEVPNDVEIADEGFVSHEGKFFNREQASAIVNAPKPIQSEQMFEQKMSQGDIDKTKAEAQRKRDDSSGKV